MKQKNYQRWSRPLLLTLLSIFMAFSGANSAWADAYNEGFEKNINGWKYANENLTVGTDWSYSGSLSDYILSTSYYRSGSTGLYNANSNTSNYIITPKLAAGTISFYGKAKSQATGSTVYVYVYKCTDNGNGTFTIDTSNNLSTHSYYDYSGSDYLKSGAFNQYSFELDADSHLAFLLSKAAIDDFSASNGLAVDAPAGIGVYTDEACTASVKDGVNLNYGFVASSQSQTYYIKNESGEDWTNLAISHSGNAEVTSVSSTLANDAKTSFTVSMAASGSTSDEITITAATDLSFTINVSGMVRDANKVYETLGSGSIPEDWSQTSWYFTTGYAYTSAWSQTSNARLITPKLDIKSGEKIMFEAIGTYPSTPSYQTMVVEYSSDKSTWTASEKAITLTSDWQTVEIDDIPVGSYYIAIHASQARVRNYYGGELPKVAKMTVTEPATLDFGLYDKDASPAPTKTFTIANTGTATLDGISVTSGNAAFEITGAPTSLAAGADAEVTITMSTATAGALSSLITVSATDMTDATFTVTGQVLPSGLSVIDFNDNQLPARWENTGWTFSNGAAYASYHSPAYVMTTPKIEMGDFLVVKGKIEYNSSSYYVTVKGLDANDDEVYSKKLTNDVFNNEEYKYAILSDIPTTVKKLQFVGYYGYIDEIQGINYAAALAVTTGAPAATVNTPAAYDFGECAANATVTYNFANAGAGTINITNVAITGAGAAAYSTNWTESVAAPFDLTITRTYDAGRAGAQEAVVTVTTSEGNFVINVTGTDKAANAPELSVTLGGDPVTTGDAANFGTNLKAAPSAKTYTITNSGTGTLTGTIATSDDTQFTVSKTAFSLGAAGSTTFDVALVFNTTYGAKAATITIHPTVGGLDDVVINASASTLDPEAWTEDFEGGSLPTGWVANNWTVGTFTDYENTTNMALAPSGSTAGTLITPCLTAKAGDVLTWDSYFNWYDEAMTVEYSADNQETWTKIYDAYKAQSEFGSTRYTHKEMSFTAPANGNYYLRFTSTYRNGVDNFSGFKLNLPDHMMAITASSIPSSGLKEGQAFNATVDVKENRGVAETGVIAKLYMNSVVIGTSTATDFEANESKQITIPCTPTTGADDASMYIEVVYASGSETVSTTPVNRNVAAITNLTLDEGSSAAISAGTYDNLTLVRKFTVGWNTVCLPFTISGDGAVEAFFGDGAKAYRFSGFTNGDIEFTTTSSLTASYPYIVYVPSAITEDIELHDITIAAGDVTAFYQYQSGAYFRGTYVPITDGSWTKNADGDKLYGVTAAGKIAKIGDTATSNGFRGYFDLPAGATARLSFFDETTGITTVMDAKELNNDGKVYNLNGQRVENAHKGLYIVNGRKVVVK